MREQKKHRFLFFVTVLLYISFGLLTSVIGVVIDRFQADYKVSLSIAALLPFAFYMAYGLVSVPFGSAVDRYGSKVILISGTILMAVGSLLSYYSSNYIVIIFVIFLVGVGVTAVQVAGNPFIRQLDSPAKYTANLTIIIGIGALGYAFSPLLVPVIEANNVSWQSVYLLFAIINATILIFLLLARFPGTQLKMDEKINTSQITTLLKDPIIRTYSIGIFLYVGAEVGTSSYIITYMSAVYGVSNTWSFWQPGTFLFNVFPSVTALAVALFWLFQAVGRLIISQLMKRFSEKKVFIFHSLGTVVTLLAAILTPDYRIALLMFTLTGYFTCASFTCVFSAAINSFKENHGTISGILGTAIVGGAFIGWMVGYIGDQVNMKWAMAVNVLAFLYVFGLAVYGKGKLDLKVA